MKPVYLLAVKWFFCLFYRCCVDSREGEKSKAADWISCDKFIYQNKL